METPPLGQLRADLFRTETEERMRLTPESRAVLNQLARPSARSGRLSPLGYNLTISHERRFIWFRVAKVATRTVLGHLTTHQVPLDVVHAMRMRYPVDLFEDYFKFAFVRHPQDRFLSAWRNKVVDHNYFEFDPETHAQMQAPERFAEWTATHDLADLGSCDHHLALQSRLIDLTQVDFVGRLELFDRDFAEVCDRIGAPTTKADPRNQTRPGGGSAEAASAALRDILTEIYRKDFQIFGYS